MWATAVVTAATVVHAGADEVGTLIRGGSRTLQTRRAASTRQVVKLVTLLLPARENVGMIGAEWIATGVSNTIACQPSTTGKGATASGAQSCGRRDSGNAASQRCIDLLRVRNSALCLVYAGCGSRGSVWCHGLQDCYRRL